MEKLYLAWHVFRRAKEEAETGCKSRFHRLMMDILGAQRSVLALPLAALAEEVRTTDLGVTITSLKAARLVPGASWWEWNTDLPGRLPALAGEPRVDRHGMFIKTDASGRRGVMHLILGLGNVFVDGQPLIDIMPLACNFDWREVFEPPATIMARASVEDTRRAWAVLSDPTPAEAEASPVFASWLSRHFGIVESAYADPERVLAPERDTRPWHQQQPDLLASLADELMLEVSLMLCIAITLRTTPLSITPIRPTRRGPDRRPARDDILVGYNIFDLAQGAAATAG